MKRSIILLMTVLISHLLSLTIRIPEQFSSIQDGINAACLGDIVLGASGTFYENINFKGKNIFFTSHYINILDPDTILNTIINSSKSTERDTGKVVLFLSGEDSTAILNGFTITGGAGTKWIYEYGGNIYRARGGIFITMSSPTISNHVIISNVTISIYDNILTGNGSAIRARDGSPFFINNVIVNNKSLSCGEIDLNYTRTVLKNNIIANNKVYQAVPYVVTWGGGGIGVYKNFMGRPVILENNTIIGNLSTGFFSAKSGKSGEMICWKSSNILQNNIIQGNC